MRRAVTAIAGAAALAGGYLMARRAAIPRRYYSAFAAPNQAEMLALPGPPAILGGWGNIMRFLIDPLTALDTLFGRYGPVVALASGSRTHLVSPLPDCPGTVCVTGAAQLRDIATQHEVFYRYSAAGTLYPVADAPPRLQPMREWGTGLFNVNSDVHRSQRRLLLPAFHRRRVEAYRDQMVAATDLALAGWESGGHVDMHREMKALALRIATSALFGEELKEAGTRISQQIEESLRLFVHPLTTIQVDLPGFPYHQFLNLAAEISAGMHAMVAQKRATGVDQGDVLAMLLQARDEAGNALSEAELAGHTALLFAAGHETTANALTWTLFLLAQHPDVMADLYDELSGVLQGAPPTLENLARLPLLERVLKESMRIFPPVPLNTRVAHQPTELAGHTIPAGAEMIMSIYHVHHDPALYPDPERFQPSRWESIDPTTFEYTPFSGGPRMCIGSTFAMLEMKIVLAMLLQRYRIAMAPHSRVDRSVAITMAPRDGMPMRVFAQDRRFGPATPVAGNVCTMVKLS
jgi:cytochrome P450